MIVKFFRRGKGSGAGPLNYLLVAKGKPRDGAKVLYGDPKLTEQLINATPYQQKYKSGVLSFLPKMPINLVMNRKKTSCSVLRIRYLQG